MRQAFLAEKAADEPTCFLSELAVVPDAAHVLDGELVSGEPCLTAQRLNKSLDLDGGGDHAEPEDLVADDDDVLLARPGWDAQPLVVVRHQFLPVDTGVFWCVVQVSSEEIFSSDGVHRLDIFGNCQNTQIHGGNPSCSYVLSCLPFRARNLMRGKAGATEPYSVKVLQGRNDTLKQ